MATPPRFSVSGNDLIDASTGKVLTPNEFNQLATPAEKDAIGRELTARSQMVNQAVEDQIDESAVDEDLAKGPAGSPATASQAASTPSSAVTPAPQSAPLTEAPTRPAGAPPSLPDFLTKARPLNPQFDDRELAIEYRQAYPNANKFYPPPPKDQWIAKAKLVNPESDDAELNAFYTDVYGTPEPELGFGGTLLEGAKSAGRSLKATGQAVLGDREGATQTARDQMASPKDPALTTLMDTLAAKKAELGPDAPWWDVGKSVGKAFLENPKGAGLLMTEQLPNSGVMFASAIAGSLIGAATPIPGGAIIGGLIGIFGSNIGLETGQKVIEKAADGELTPEESSAALREGAKKGAVVSAVDVATFGMTKWLTGTTTRAMEAATARVLTEEGIDVADRAAVQAASKNPTVRQKVLDAQQQAKDATHTLAQRAVRGGSEVALESLGEGVGEYLGEVVATGKGDKVEAFIEAVAGFGQSAAEIGIASTLSRRSQPSGLETPSPIEPPDAVPPAATIETVAPVLTAGSIDEALESASKIVDSPPITTTQLDTTIGVAPDSATTTYTPAHLSTDQASFERLIGERVPAEEVRVIDPKTLPAQTDPTQGLSQEKYDALSVMAQAFGKRLVVFEAGGTLPNGAFWQSQDPSRIYLASNTQGEDAFTVFAHEAMHTMQGTALYESYKKTIVEQATPQARKIAAIRHGDTLTQDQLTEEIAADVGSTELQKPEMWEKVFANLRAQVGDEQATVEVVGFVDSLKQIIARIKSMIATRSLTVRGKTLAELYVQDLEKVQDALAQAVGSALYNKKFATPEQTKAVGKLTLNRRALGDRTLLPRDVTDTFDTIAKTQRGAPEAATRAVQKATGPGLMANAVEQAGDLLHRMTEGAKAGTSNRLLVKEKVDKLLTSLTHAYGFETEHAENLANNQADSTAVAEALKTYATEYKAIPVYNRAQWLARAIATSLGSMQIADAVANLKALQKLVDSADFAKAAFAHQRGADTKIQSYLQPVPGKLIGRQILNSKKMPDFDLYDLDVDLPGHPKGSSVTQESMAEEGYRIVPSDLITAKESKEAKQNAARETVKAAKKPEPKVEPKAEPKAEPKVEPKVGSVLNIGLNVNDGSTISAQTALSALKLAGATVLSHTVRTSNTEPTLIAELATPLTPTKATALSATLKQDAIAQRLPDGTGALYGPAADKWGPFNPEYFLGPTADTVAAPQFNPKGTAKLVHYSRQEGLTEISPTFHGTGQIGAERLRQMNDGKAYIPRSFFYRAGTKIEPRFKGLTKYQVEVPESSLVDLATLTGTPTERERAAKKAGYKGYYNSESSMPNVVAMFGPVSTDNVGTSAPVSTHPVWKELPHTESPFDSNNRWGFGGGIGTLYDFGNGITAKIGTAYVRHGDPTKFITVSEKGVRRFDEVDTKGSRADAYEKVKSLLPSQEGELRSDPLFSPRTWVSQIETPEFKRWFGQSKVVNADGSPKVVYHGTERGKFTIFQTPSFFTEEKAEAIGYATLTDVDELPDIRYVSESAAPPIPDSFDPFTDYVPVASDIDVPNRVFVEDGTDRLVFWDGGTNPIGDKNIKILSGVMAQNDKPVRMATADNGASHPEDVRARQVVWPVYLSIQNPIELPWNEANLLGKRLGANPETVKVRVAELQKQGYDGIVTESDDARIFQGRSVKQYIPFSPEQIKLAQGNRGAFDRTNPDIRFAPKQPKPAPTWTADQPGKLDAVIRVLQDKAIDIKRLTESMQKAGRVVPDQLNPVLAEEMYMKRAEQRAADFTNDELRPFVQQMRLGKVTLTQVDQYLQAQHIVTDDVNARLQAINPDLQGTPVFDRLAGMTDAEAKAILAKAPPVMASLAARAQKMVEKTRDLMVTYGLESQDRINEWRKQYQAYVPLNREGFEDEGHPTGTGRSVRGSTAKIRTGSGLAVTNVLANIAQARDQIITRGEKQRPVIAMAGLLMLHPNPDIATLDKPAQITMTNPQTGLPMTVPGNLTNYTVPTVRRFDPASGTVKTYPDPTYKGRDNVVNFRVGGKDYAIVFNERNERAMEAAKAFKELDTPKLTGIMAAIAPYTRYLASINTQYNPIFGIVNFVRDAQFAMLALSSTPLAGKKTEVLRNAGQSLAGIYQDARAVRLGRHPTSQTAQMWERFQHVGGPTGYRDLFFSSTDRAAEIQRMLEPNRLSAIDSPQKLGKRLEETWLLKTLSDYNTTMENSIRLGVFTTAVQMGLSDIQAASYAKNITVNFNKKGQIGAQMGSLFAFFNANVQGTARIFETIFERTPTGIRLSSTGKQLVAGGILVGALQTFALAMAGFGDDEPPEYIKARNLIIPMPGTQKGYGLLPMPLGFNLLPNIGRAAAEAVRAGVEGREINPLKRASDLIGTLYGTFSPLGGTGGPIQELMPTVADPLAAVVSNKDWTGKSISKEDRSTLDPTPGHTRVKDTASVWATALAKGINWATGGTEYRPGAASPTPDMIDYLVEQVTGGIGREISKGSQVLQTAVTGEELPFHKVPLLGRFAGSATGATAVRSTFYDNVKAVNLAYREFEGRAKDRTGDAHDFLRAHPEGRLREAAISVERTIGELNKVKKDLIKEGASRATIRLRETQITNLMERFNEMVARQQEPQP